MTNKINTSTRNQVKVMDSDSLLHELNATAMTIRKENPTQYFAADHRSVLCTPPLHRTSVIIGAPIIINIWVSTPTAITSSWCNWVKTMKV
jgi:hypothetical protein